MPHFCKAKKCKDSDHEPVNKARRVWHTKTPDCINGTDSYTGHFLWKLWSLLKLACLQTTDSVRVLASNFRYKKPSYTVQVMISNRKKIINLVQERSSSYYIHNCMNDFITTWILVSSSPSLNPDYTSLPA